jgi:hypothetical protein
LIRVFIYLTDGRGPRARRFTLEYRMLIKNVNPKDLNPGNALGTWG